MPDTSPVVAPIEFEHGYTNINVGNPVTITPPSTTVGKEQVSPLNPLEAAQSQAYYEMGKEQWIKNSDVETPFKSPLDQTLRYDDPNLGYTAFDPNLEQKYGDAHPVKSSVNNIIKLGANAVGSFANGLLTIPTVIGSLSQGKLSDAYDNDLTKGISDWMNNLEQVLPSYEPSYKKEHPWLSYINPIQLSSLMYNWTNVAKNLGFTIGAMGSAVVEDLAIGALTDGVGLPAAIAANYSQLNKLTKYLIGGEEAAQAYNIARKGGKSVLDAIDAAANVNQIASKTRYGLGLFTSAYGEGVFEAANIYSQTKQDLVQQYKENNFGNNPDYITNQQIEGASKDAANAGLLFNTALLMATNSITLGNVLKPTELVEKQLQAEVAKGLELQAKNINEFEVAATASKKGLLPILKNVATHHLVTTGASEGFEEGAQYVISQGTEDYYTRRLNNDNIDEADSFWKAVSKGVHDTLFTTQGRENIMMGALSGVLIHAFNKVSNKVRGVKDNRMDIAQSIQSMLNSTTTTSLFNTQYDELVTATSLARDYDAANKAGDIYQAKNLRFQQLFNFVESGVRANKFNLRMGQLEMLKSLTNDDFKNLFGIEYNTANKQKISDYVDNVIQESQRIKGHIDKVNRAFTNPFNRKRDDVQHQAFEYYKAQLALSSATIEKNRERVNSLGDEVRNISSTIDPNKIMALTTEKGINSLIKNFTAKINDLKESEKLAKSDHTLAESYRKDREFLEGKIDELKSNLENSDPDVYLKTVNELHNYFANAESTNNYGAYIDPIDSLTIYNKSQDMAKLTEATTNGINYYNKLLGKKGFDTFSLEVTKNLQDTSDTVYIDDKGNIQVGQKPQKEEIPPEPNIVTAVHEKEYTPEQKKQLETIAQKETDGETLTNDELQLKSDNQQAIEKEKEAYKINKERSKKQPSTTKTSVPASVLNPDISTISVPKEEVDDEPVGQFETNVTPQERSLAQVFSGFNPLKHLNEMYAPSDRNDKGVKVRDYSFMDALRKVLFGKKPKKVRDGLTVKVETSTTGKTKDEYTQLPHALNFYRSGYSIDATVRHGNTVVGIMTQPESLNFKRGDNYVSIYDMTREEYPTVTGNAANTYDLFMEHLNNYRDIYNEITKGHKAGEVKEVSNKELRKLADIEIAYGSAEYTNNAANAQLLSKLNVRQKGDVVLSLPSIYNVATGRMEKTDKPVILNAKELTPEQLQETYDFISNNINQIRNINKRYVYLNRLPDGSFSKVGILAARPVTEDSDYIAQLFGRLKTVSQNPTPEEIAGFNTKFSDEIYIADSRTKRTGKADLTLKVDPNGDVSLAVHAQDRNNKDINQTITVPKERVAELQNAQSLAEEFNNRMAKGDLGRIGMHLSTQDFKRSIMDDEQTSMAELEKKLTVAVKTPDVYRGFNIRFTKKEEQASAASKTKPKEEVKKDTKQEADKWKEQQYEEAVKGYLKPFERSLEEAKNSGKEEHIKQAEQRVEEAKKEAIADLKDDTKNRIEKEYQQKLNESIVPPITQAAPVVMPVINPKPALTEAPRIATATEQQELERRVNNLRMSMIDRKDLSKILQNGEWGMLTGENPNAQKATTEENIKYNKKAEKWLKDRGYLTIPIVGKYGNLENSFYVPNLSFKDAVAFANAFNQESVATNMGLVYQDGSFNPRIYDETKIGVDYNDPNGDFFSVINAFGTTVGFSIGYDFNTKTTLEEQQRQKEEANRKPQLTEEQMRTTPVSSDESEEEQSKHRFEIYKAWVTHQYDDMIQNGTISLETVRDILKSTGKGEEYVEDIQLRLNNQDLNYQVADLLGMDRKSLAFQHIRNYMVENGSFEIAVRSGMISPADANALFNTAGIRNVTSEFNYEKVTKPLQDLIDEKIEQAKKDKKLIEEQTVTSGVTEELIPQPEEVYQAAEETPQEENTIEQGDDVTYNGVTWNVLSRSPFGTLHIQTSDPKVGRENEKIINESQVKKVIKVDPHANDSYIRILQRMEQRFPQVKWKLVSNNEDWKGRFKNGVVEVNTKKATNDTPIHEYLHPFVYLLRRDNENLYRNLIEELQQYGEAYILEVANDKNYDGLTSEEKFDESLVRYLANAMSQNFDSEGRRYDSENYQEDEKGNVIHPDKQAAWYERASKAVQGFYSWLRDKILKLIDRRDVKNNNVVEHEGFDLSNPKDLSLLTELKTIANLVVNKQKLTDEQKELRAKYKDVVKKEANDLRQKIDERKEGSFIKATDRGFGVPFSPADLDFNFTLEDLADFLSFNDNIQINYGKDAASINTLEAYQFATVDEAKNLLDKVKRKAEQLEQTADKRLGSKALHDELIAVRTLIRDFDENTFVQEYIRMGVTSLTIARRIVNNISSELRKDNLKNLKPDDIQRLNKDVMEARTMYGMYEDVNKLLSYDVDDFDKDEWDDLRRDLDAAIATKEKIGGMIGKLTTEWLFPEFDELQQQVIANNPDKKSLLLTKEEFAQKLKYIERDASFMTYWLGSAITSRDPISQVIAVKVKDILNKNYEEETQLVNDVRLSYHKFLADKALPNDTKKVTDYYKNNYLRTIKVYEPIGRDAQGNIIRDYVDRIAFHTEFNWHTWEDDLRKEVETYPKALTYQQEKDNDSKKIVWIQANTQTINGQQVPSEKYRNQAYTTLKNDTHFSLLTKAYNEANEKYREQSLSYGIVPQSYKPETIIEKVKDRAKRLKSYGKDLVTDKNLNAVEKASKFVKDAGSHMLGGDAYEAVEDLNLDETYYRNIKSPYTHLIKNQNEVYLNLPETVLGFSKAANYYSSLKEIQPNIENFKLMLTSNPKFGIEARKAMKVSRDLGKVWDRFAGKPQTVEAERLNKQLLAQLNDVFYGDDEFNADVNLAGIKININTVAKNIGFYTAARNLAGNLFAGISNVTIGNAQTLAEAVGGRYYNLKDWGKAEVEYWKNVPKFLADGSVTVKSKITQLGVRYDAIQGEFRDKNGRVITGSFMRKINTSSLFFLSHAGEHQIQLTGMLALMNATKVKLQGGKEISLYDAYEVTKDGIYRLRPDAIWNTKNDLEFTRKLHSISRDLNGAYADYDKSMLQRYWIGRLVLQYRKYMYPAFRARFARERIDFERGDVDKGYYRTFMRKLINEAKEHQWRVWKVAYDTLFNKKQMTKQERYAIAKFKFDMLTIGLMTVLGAFITGGSGDDDKDKGKQWLINSAGLLTLRLRSDIATYSVFSAQDFSKQLQNPAAAVQSITNVLDFLGQFISDTGHVLSGDGLDVYKNKSSTHEAGDSKLGAKFGKIVPIWRQWDRAANPQDQIQYYQLINQDVDKHH
jgi:hypothetical protein